MLQEQTNYLQQIIQNSKGMVDNVKAYEGRIKSFLEKSYADFPISSNALFDTKHFKTVCQGKVNTPMGYMSAHKTAAAFGYGTGKRAGQTRVLPSSVSRIEVVTLDNLDMKGMPMDATLQKAAGVLRNGAYYGSTFRVLLLDFTLPKGHWYTDILRMAGPQYTGITNKGQFRVQSRAFINVLAQSGTAYGALVNHPYPSLVAGKADLGKKWQYKTATRISLYANTPRIRVVGEGRIKMAIALPYSGVGYHGPDNFVWAGFVGSQSGNRSTSWTHDDIIVK